MQYASFIFKNRFDTYYFRQRTPIDILILLPSAKKEVKISLKTKEKSKALILARLQKSTFDSLFKEIRDGVMKEKAGRESFQELPINQQRSLLLKQRTVEAIQDQQYTQQLFFLFERKNKIKNLFNNFEELRQYSLSEVDLSSVDKINHFIAIADLLADDTLADPTPYINQIQWKPQPQLKKYTNSSGVYADIKVKRLVIKRNKKTAKNTSTPTALKRQSTTARTNVGKTLIGLLDSEIQSGEPAAIRTQTDDIHHREDVVLEGISLENEQDVANFAKLMSLIEKGEDVNTADFAQFTQPVVVPKSMLKMSELFAKFYKERKSEWNNQKTHTTNLSIYNTFVEIVGDIFVDEFNADHANQFVDTLQELPANRNKLKAYRDKSIDEILALKGTFEPMKAQNANKYIERISDALEWGKSRHLLPENLLKQMKIKDKNQKVRLRDKRHRFNSEDLSLIFNSDKYLKSSHSRTYQHWLPLLGLYTGARLQELSQLRLNDIYKKDGIWVIDINAEEDKLVKTINSPRLIPVHKSLIALGFIKYIDHLKECYESTILSTTLVFPDLVKGRDGYGHNSAKWFARYLTQIHVKEDGKSFHSLRHTFADEMKQARVIQAIVAELIGHEVEGETFGRYGKKYAVSTLKKEIDAYSPLTVEQLKKVKGFKLWKEFENPSLKAQDSTVDKNKSIYKDKNLVKALANNLSKI
jgi:integrase